MKKKPSKRLNEYLRRNLLHCASCGVVAGLKVARDRLLKSRKPPKWLMKSLAGVLERAARVEVEMARHRDELSPYKH